MFPLLTLLARPGLIVARRPHGRHVATYRPRSSGRPRSAAATQSAASPVFTCPVVTRSTLGAILAGMVIVGGFLVVLLNKDATGYAAILTAGGFLVGNSLYQRHRQEKERKEKLQAIEISSQR